MARAFDGHVTAKGTLKGKLDVYRYIDNVWTFVLSDPVLKLAPTLTSARKDDEELTVPGPLKMVLVDAKVVKYDDDDDDDKPAP